MDQAGRDRPRLGRITRQAQRCLEFAHQVDRQQIVDDVFAPDP